MNQTAIKEKLRQILDKEDAETDGIINRKRSSEHSNDIEVLLEHVSLVVSYLRLDAEAARRELFDVRAALEEN